MRACLTLFVMVAWAGMFTPGQGSCAGPCERYFTQGAVLEWTRLEAGLVVDSGELRILRVLGNKVDGLQAPHASGEAWQVRGEVDGESITLHVPRWGEVWKGVCNELEIIGQVKGDEFIMRLLEGGQFSFVPAGSGLAGREQDGLRPNMPGVAPRERQGGAGWPGAQESEATRFSKSPKREGRFAGDASAPQSSLAWMPAQGGEIPPNAIVSGQEPGRTLYVCRTAMPGIHGCGKIGGGFSGCNVGQFGREAIAGKYDVLVGPGHAVGWVATDGESLAAVSRKFAPWDQETGPFVCRAEYNNGMHPGQIRLGDAGCSIGYGGLQYIVPRFEVMTRR